MITVELVDDQSLVRAGFHALLDAEDDIEVVAQAADGESAVALARAHRPQVVLMDIRMPKVDGLQATAQITGDPDLCDTRVVVLTTFELDEYVFGALRAGASGFLLKDVEPADLVAAVRVVAAGEALLAPRLTRRLIEAFVDGTTTRNARHRGAGAAHPAGARGARPGRPGMLQRRDRRAARAVSIDRQDPRGSAVRQAGSTRPGPARRHRIRIRTGPTRRPPTPSPGLVEGALASLQARQRVAVAVALEVL